MNAGGDIQNNSGAKEGVTNGAPAPTAGESIGAGPDQEPKETSRRTATPADAPGTVLPNKAAEDDPRRWGDQPDNYDHDAWLQEQKPPHWG